MIYIEDETNRVDEVFHQLAVKSVQKCLEYFSFEYEVDVSITLTGDEDIRYINREYRQIDRATDVLSFPMVDWPKPIDILYLEENMNEHVNPDTECILLGDIVLSMEKVQSQAKEYGHSEQREFAFLIVHSMLHLFGYDHMEEEEEKEMIQLQKDIMLTINYEK